MAERDQHNLSVIGSGLSEEHRQYILRAEKQMFDHPELSDLTKIERPKTETETEIIKLVCQYGDQIGDAYGAPPFSVPVENFHIIPQQNWPEQHQIGTGFFDAQQQQIAVMETSTGLTLAHQSFHEYMHLKSFGKLQIIPGGYLETARLGLISLDRSGEKESFRLLNEAVTEELAISFIEQAKSHPLLADEAALTDRLRGLLGENVYGPDRGADLSVPSSNVFAAWIASSKSGDPQIRWEAFSYPRERVALNNLIDKTIDRRELDDLTTEDLQRHFVSGYLTGNIMSVGRTIDTTFGPGTFREIGSIVDAEKLLDYVDQL